MSDYQTTAPTTTAITLADAKAHLNVSTTYDDALIVSQIKAATQLLEDKTFDGLAEWRDRFLGSILGGANALLNAR